MDHDEPFDSLADVTSKFGEFSLLAGGGSTGRVWRCREIATGRAVAIKLVDVSVMSEGARIPRMLRELKQLMRLSSNRVERVLDAGETPWGGIWVATEFFDGESLEKLLPSTPIPIAEAVKMVVLVGGALLDAQKAGLIHRDLAPKNVLIAQSGDFRVINFAIPRELVPSNPAAAAYVSPEQLQGRPVDQRSNTYSLGAMLYRMVTGRLPFEATTLESIVDMHVASDPLPPSRHVPNMDVLDRVTLKALAKSTSRRQLTLRLFLSEVEQVGTIRHHTGSNLTDGGHFPRTMLFVGGQHDDQVARLVEKAIAARPRPPEIAPANTRPTPPPPLRSFNPGATDLAVGAGYAFISYSRADEGAVERWCRQIAERLGLPIWRDHDIPPGREWDETIAQAITDAACVLVFLSRTASTSPNVRDEVYFALDRKKPVIAVYLEDHVPPPGLVLRLGRIESIHLSRLREDDFVDKLRVGLAHAIGSK
jgi:serine/threonine protein kinase